MDIDRKYAGKGLDIEVVCFLYDFSINIAHQQLKFGEWIAPEVLFPMIVDLAILKNISCHIFKGEGDEVPQSTAL